MEAEEGEAEDDRRLLDGCGFRKRWARSDIRRGGWLAANVKGNSALLFGLNAGLYAARTISNRGDRDGEVGSEGALIAVS